MRARPLAMADASSACELDPVGGKVAHAVPIAWTPTEVNRLVAPLKSLHSLWLGGQNRHCERSEAIQIINKLNELLDRRVVLRPPRDDERGLFQSLGDGCHGGNGKAVAHALGPLKAAAEFPDALAALAAGDPGRGILLGVEAVGKDMHGAARGWEQQFESSVAR